ncbi:MAG TPA: LytTR family DNA-binding domain-containing protein [Pseudoduganella sp.]
MKAIVVEDSRLAREGLVRMLREFPELDVVGDADHPDSALELIRASRPELLFLDIHMPGASGFDLLERLDYAPRIIFTTAYSEHAIRSFDFHTVDYLVKPIRRERLAAAIAKLPATASASKPALDIDSRLFIKDGERCHLVALHTIRYIESCKNYVQVFFEGKSAYLKKPLADVEERLPARHFFRISRQHIVNLRAVTGIEETINCGYRLTLDDGKVLEVSRRNASELKDLLSF